MDTKKWRATTVASVYDAIVLKSSKYYPLVLYAGGQKKCSEDKLHHVLQKIIPFKIMIQLLVNKNSDTEN